jgi:hypothetical protein
LMVLRHAGSESDGTGLRSQAGGEFAECDPEAILRWNVRGQF